MISLKIILLIPFCILTLACSNGDRPNGKGERPTRTYNPGTNIPITNTATDSIHPCGPKLQILHISDYIFDYEIPKNSSSVDWELLQLEVSPRNPQEIVKNTFKLRFSLFPKAYACPPSWIVTDQTVEKISISSDNYFNEDFPAGAELNQYFNAYFVYYGDVNLSEYPSEEYKLAPVHMYLSLNSKPLYSRQNFILRIEFTDGNISEIETGDIYLD